MPEPRIMYVELKTGEADKGPAWIVLVKFSKTGKTIYYRGKAFQTSKGQGVGANYFDVETGEEYWISGPKKNGQDRLRGGTVEIDEDIEDRYWTEIRGMA